MSKCTFCIQRMLRTGKQDNKVCVPLNFALICTQPLQTCSYSYLVLFVTVNISYFRSMHYIWLNISNIWPNFNIGLIARTVRVFANTTIDHLTHNPHNVDTPIIRTLPVSKGVCIIGVPMYTLFSQTLPLYVSTRLPWTGTLARTRRRSHPPCSADTTRTLLTWSEGASVVEDLATDWASWSGQGQVQHTPLSATRQKDHK